MVSFAIEALVRAGVTELMVVTGGTHAGEFLRLLGNGHDFGIDLLSYAYQERPGGIAEALGLAERFVGGDRCCVLLADNVFECPLAPVVISGAEVRKFAGLPEPPAREKPRPPEVAEALTRATVWVRPTATDVSAAGVLIENDLVLTCGKGLWPGDRAGVAFPLRDGGKWVAERAAYRDPLGLQLKGCWRGGTSRSICRRSRPRASHRSTSSR